MGGIPRTVREIGSARTKELVMTGRTFTADEAQEGFLNRISTAEELPERTDELAQEVAAKAELPLTATKRHVNAVTGQMVGIDRSWSGADGLLAGMADPECRDHRPGYLAARR